jgi:hypothetical protein
MVNKREIHEMVLDNRILVFALLELFNTVVYFVIWGYANKDWYGLLQTLHVVTTFWGFYISFRGEEQTVYIFSLLSMINMVADAWCSVHRVLDGSKCFTTSDSCSAKTFWGFLQFFLLVWFIFIDICYTITSMELAKYRILNNSHRWHKDKEID